MNERAAEQAVLQVRRTRQWYGLVRRLAIRIDGKVVFRLWPGGRAERVMAPGAYEVAAKMDWCASEPLHVVLSPGGTVRLVAEVTGGTSWKVWRNFGVGGRVFRVRHEEPEAAAFE